LRVLVFVHESVELKLAGAVELNARNGIPSTVAEHIAVAEQIGGIDAIGGPKMYNMYHRFRPDTAGALA
jgi:hypothetical protein